MPPPHPQPRETEGEQKGRGGFGYGDVRKAKTTTGARVSNSSKACGLSGLGINREERSTDTQGIECS